MNTTTSKDGTRIAYEKLGSGPPVLLVDGAMCHRKFGPMQKLAPMLASRFTVVHYDRRGRGDSTDTQPYAVEREIEDIQALVDVLGAAPFVYGTSSGAMLAMRAVAAGVPARALAMHEPPLALDPSYVREPADWRERIREHVAKGERGDVIKTFLKAVGVPAFVIAMMRVMPGVWSSLKNVAHTMPYDIECLGDTQSGRPLPDDIKRMLASVRVPTQVLVGGKSPPHMHHAAKAVAHEIESASVRVLPGQEHNVAAKAIAPALLELFDAAAKSGSDAAAANAGGSSGAHANV